jgi:hypothetical protein
MNGSRVWGRLWSELWSELWSRVWSRVWAYGQPWIVPIGARVSPSIQAIGLILILILLGLPTPSLAAAMPSSMLTLNAPIGAASASVDRSNVDKPNPDKPNIDKPNIDKPNIDNIPAEKIDQFVRAYQQVLALVQRRQGELQAAETEAESQFRQRDIEAAAMALIEQAGLTRPEYFQLLDLASVDSELGDQIATLLQESSPGIAR